MKEGRRREEEERGFRVTQRGCNLLLLFLGIGQDVWQGYEVGFKREQDGEKMTLRKGKELVEMGTDDASLAQCWAELVFSPPPLFLFASFPDHRRERLKAESA